MAPFALHTREANFSGGQHPRPACSSIGSFLNESYDGSIIAFKRSHEIVLQDNDTLESRSSHGTVEQYADRLFSCIRTPPPADKPLRHFGSLAGPLQVFMDVIEAHRDLYLTTNTYAVTVESYAQMENWWKYFLKGLRCLTLVLRTVEPRTPAKRPVIDLCESSD